MKTKLTAAEKRESAANELARELKRITHENAVRKLRAKEAAARLEWNVGQ